MRTTWCDHQAVNDKALALIKKLNVTPEDNDTSKALAAQAEAKQRVQPRDAVEWVNEDFIDHTATATAGEWDVAIAAKKTARLRIHARRHFFLLLPGPPYNDGDRSCHRQIADKPSRNAITPARITRAFEGCPEYKVTAVQVSRSNGPTAYQVEYEEFSAATRHILPNEAAE